MHDYEFINWFKDTLYAALAKELVARNFKDFVESEHPRDREGKFTEKGSGAIKERVEVHNPPVLAGIKRGKPMTHRKAMNVNPNFKKGPQYKENCTLCVLAYNLCRRGYDVQAKGIEDNNVYAHYLMQHIEYAFIDPKTNSMSSLTTKSDITSAQECYKWLDKKIKQNRLYAFVYHRKGGKLLHVVILQKNKFGQLCLSDPQNNTEKCKKKELLELFNELQYTTPLKLLRTDDKEIFEPVVARTVIPANNYSQ